MIIELRSLFKTYDQQPVLRGLSLQVAAGEVYGLVGPNGAGKTTAINILCGLLEADLGVATVAGEETNRASRHRIGVVPQEICLYDHLTCRENLCFFADMYCLDRRTAAQRVDEVIEQLQLAAHADSQVATLSGGWRRRVNIAASIVHSPQALILDEPTAGLDLEARHELWQQIDRLRASDVAILLTTHQLDEAEHLCSRIGIMADGVLAAEGTMAELRRLVPAESLAVVETQNETALRERVRSLAWDLSNAAGRLTLWLPQRLSLEETAQALDGCGLSSLALREVGLEQVYLRVAAGGHAS